MRSPAKMAWWTIANTRQNTPCIGVHFVVVALSACHEKRFESTEDCMPEPNDGLESQPAPGRARNRKIAGQASSSPSYDGARGASVHILAISSFTETYHRLSYSCDTKKKIAVPPPGLGTEWAGIRAP